MKFQPMSKQQLKNILPEEKYEFEVTSAVEKVSKSGNNMIAITLRINGNNKNEVHFINDWIVQPQEDELEEKVKNKIWKIRSFCYSIGLEDKYENGSLSADDCLNKKGSVKIKIRQDQNGNDVNSVGYYIEKFSIKPLTSSSKASETNDHALSTHKDSFIDDDLPF